MNSWLPIGVRLCSLFHMTHSLSTQLILLSQMIGVIALSLKLYTVYCYIYFSLRPQVAKKRTSILGWHYLIITIFHQRHLHFYFDNTFFCQIHSIPRWLGLPTRATCALRPGPVEGGESNPKTGSTTATPTAPNLFWRWSDLCPSSPDESTPVGNPSACRSAAAAHSRRDAHTGRFNTHRALSGTETENQKAR